MAEQQGCPGAVWGWAAGHMDTPWEFSTHLTEAPPSPASPQELPCCRKRRKSHEHTGTQRALGKSWPGSRAEGQSRATETSTAAPCHTPQEQNPLTFGVLHSHPTTAEPPHLWGFTLTPIRAEPPHLWGFCTHPLSLQRQLPTDGSVVDYLGKTPNNITITYHKSLVFPRIAQCSRHLSNSTLLPAHCRAPTHQWHLEVPLLLCQLGEPSRDRTCHPHSATHQGLQGVVTTTCGERQRQNRNSPANQRWQCPRPGWTRLWVMLQLQAGPSSPVVAGDSRAAQMPLSPPDTVTPMLE